MDQADIRNAHVILSTAAGTAGGVFSMFFGAWNDDLTAFLILMAVDFITGVILAAVFQKSTKSENGALSSKECFRGIARKTCELLVVSAAYQSERLTGIPYVRSLVIWGLCASELISIMENAAFMGILPESVQKVFDKIIDVLNKKNNDDKDKKE